MVKTNIAGLELHYLIQELKFLENARVDKIFIPSKKEIILQMHVPSKGTFQLHIDEKSLYLTKHKSPSKQPNDFCMYLRKKIGSARLRKIEQVGFERILKLDFEAKDSKYSLIAEIFSKGNIILTKNNIILVAAEYQKWASRTIRPKETYVPPTRDHNFLTLTETQLKQILQNSNKESLVKSIALDLGLGGTYAEEVCLLAKANKDQLPKDIKDTKALYQALQKIKDQKINPIIYYKNDQIKDITPFPLQHFKDLKSESKESYSQALDDYFSTFTITKEKANQQKRLDEINNIIKEQKQHIKQLEKSELENKNKAEALYNNYQEISTLLKELKQISKTHSWSEIKEKLKGHKKIKEVIPKDKSIVLEI